MSISVTSAWLVMGFMALTACTVLLERIFRFRPKKAEDMIAVFRPVSMTEVEALLDPGKEAELHAGLDRKELRERRQMRQRVAFQYVRHLSFNAAMMVDYATSRWNGDPGTRKLIQQIVNAGLLFRIYSLFTLLKLAAGIMLSPLLPAPRASKALTLNNINGILAYKLIITATACLIITVQGKGPGKGFLDAAGTWVESPG